MIGERPNWFPDWDSECVAIVGAGPSLTKADVDKLRDRIHVIVVNSSYKLCPWADVLYGCDGMWWLANKEASKFPGLKIAFDLDNKLSDPEIKKIKIRGWQRRGQWTNDILIDHWGEIGSGANSCFQASNLAVQFGATGIMFLGMDMMANGRAHWHENHLFPLVNPIVTNFSDWIKYFKLASPTFARLGIDVVNCTRSSALTGYHKMTIEQAFERWGL